MSPLEYLEVEAIESALKGARWAIRLYTKHPALWLTYLRILDASLELEGIVEGRCPECGLSGCQAAAS